MRQNNTNYSASSIKTLEGLTPFRKSPGIYIGSTNEHGLHHVVKEIVNNSVDEFLNGSCNEISIKLLPDGGIEITDNGRGFPHGMLDNTFSILGGCFGKEHTGGKFNNTGDSGYNTSGGMHGIGCKCAAALGIKTIAISYRDGIQEIVEFSQGKMLKQITDGICDKNLHGVTVIWYPDEEIFETVDFNLDRIEKELCQEYSYLNSGLKFIITDERDLKNIYKKEYYSDKGILDYLDYLNGNNEYVLNPLYLAEKEGNFSVEIGIAYNNKYSNPIKLYTNSIPQTKGTHLTGFKTAWTLAINKFARANKILKEKDVNLTGEDLAEGQILIINFKMIDPVFEGQIKENLTSSEGRTYTNKLISNSIDNYLEAHKDEIKEVISKALSARRVREAARKAREAARNIDKEKKTVLKMPSKLADCNSSDRKKCELFLTEGDSASGGAKTIRDAEYQAVLGLKGKILNVLCSDVQKIQKNAEIMDFIRALGLSWSDDGLKVIYNEGRLRYGKIIIAADRDSDGSHIQLLILTCIWRLIPELILKGKVYIALPPLYKAEVGNKYYYLQDKKELAAFEEKNKNFTLTYFKGLGEADPEELGHMIISPETRLLQKVTVADIEKANKIFFDLMGGDSGPKKDFVFGRELREIL